MPRSCRRHASEVARSLNERSLEIRSRTNALPEGRLSPGARGDHCPAAARVLRGSFSQRRENSLSCVPARCDFFFRKERASCGRSAGASERRCAGARRGTGPKTRVHASAPECVSRYAATRPCSPRNRPRSSGVSFLTTKFLAYGTTLRDQAQPFVWHTGRLITGWRKISGALIGHSPWV